MQHKSSDWKMTLAFKNKINNWPYKTKVVVFFLKNYHQNVLGRKLLSSIQIKTKHLTESYSNRCDSRTLGLSELEICMGKKTKGRCLK